MANGDVLLQKPPPWAYPLWTAQEAYRNSNERMSRSTAQAIDQAMTHVSEAKVNFVSVSLSVEAQLHGQPGNTEVDLHGGSRCPAYSKGVSEMARPGHDSDVEWVRVVLTADPRVRMEDIGDQAPRRRKEHRRVPSTVAIEEVKASLLVIFSIKAVICIIFFYVAVELHILSLHLVSDLLRILSCQLTKGPNQKTNSYYKHPKHFL